MTASTLVKDAAAIKGDDELNDLLKKLSLIKTGRTFKKWKNSFLDRLETFLEQENIDNADVAYRKFSKHMEVFVKLIKEVNEHVDKKQLTVEQYTVKARMSLGEMSKVMTDIIANLEALIPQTSQNEIKSGYNKFHIGAVLVRDNFSEYSRLDSCRDVLTYMRKVSLNDVADKQILEEMDNYVAKLTKFCEIMADLGLYEVMLKCMEFADDMGPDLSMIIFLDCKTGGIGELPREDILMKRILSTKGVDADGNDIFNEAATTEEAQEKIIKIINENPRLKIGFGTNQNQYNNNDVSISEIEKVQNMWGVKLKKTPKNVKGEEFIFICQKTGQYGEMSRKTAIETEIIHEVRGDENTKGPFQVDEAYHDFQERSELVETVRTLLKLGITAEK